MVSFQLVTAGLELSSVIQPEAEVALRIDLALLGRFRRLLYGAQGSCPRHHGPRHRLGHTAPASSAQDELGASPLL
jgi:hypothetical protein